MDTIATLGPSRLTSTRINSFIDEGVTIFRVNGAHTDAHMAASIVEEVRRFAATAPRIMVDLPTNKIRVMNISEPIVFPYFFQRDLELIEAIFRQRAKKCRDATRLSTSALLRLRLVMRSPDRTGATADASSARI